MTKTKRTVQFYSDAYYWYSINIVQYKIVIILFIYILRACHITHYILILIYYHSITFTIYTSYTRTNIVLYLRVKNYFHKIF